MIPRAGPAGWERGLALLAAIGILISARAAWTAGLVPHRLASAALDVCYVGVLVLAVAALVVRGRRGFTAVEVSILLLAIVRVAATYVLDHSASDEGAFTAQAAVSFLHGEHVYGVPWAHLFNGSVVLTRTMDGGGDYTYGYPPLVALLAAAPLAVIRSLPPADAATLVTSVALVAAAVAGWLLVAPGWRSAVVAATLSFPLVVPYAVHGFPGVVALAFLVPVVARWSAIGSGSGGDGVGTEADAPPERRWPSRGDVLRGIALGLACAAHQLAWVLTPFLLVGLYALRRGDRGPRTALRVVATLAVIAGATFLVVNLPFIVRDGTAWLPGILTLLTQHALPHGPGLIDVSYRFTNGSGALDFYSYATALLAAGLLVGVLLFARTLGAAVAVLPWTILLLSIRAQDAYFVLMAPLWVVSAATVAPAAFDRAWRSPVERLGSVGRAAVATALLAPAAVCALVALATPPPLAMRISSVERQPSGNRGVSAIDVVIENRSGAPLAPHFALSREYTLGPFWTIASGPTQLGPHKTAAYRLVAPGGRAITPGVGGYLKLRALTDAPQTLTTTSVPAS